jgi:hypothetical protein
MYKRSVSHKPEYENYLGQTYRLKEPMYIVLYYDRSNDPGSLTPPGKAGLSEVSEEHVGEECHDGKILAVVREGTVLEVVDVRESHSTVAGTHHNLVVRPQGPLAKDWPKIHAGPIDNWDDPAAAFLEPKYAERIE